MKTAFRPCKKRNKPSTRVGYQGVIDRCIISLVGSKKVHNVKRPYVLPSPRHLGQHLTTGEYYGGWSRALKAAGATHVGTHGIRHRSATDIANSGIPVKVGMALTAHKTVVMFMRYVYT